MWEQSRRTGLEENVLTLTGNSVNKGGALPRKLPRRYYRYALLDSLDAPFATFRYYCRSWREHIFLHSGPFARPRLYSSTFLESTSCTPCG